MNESEETEEIKISPLYPYLLHGYQALPNCMPISIGRPDDVRYTTPSPHLTSPCCLVSTLGNQKSDSYKEMTVVERLNI